MAECWFGPAMSILQCALPSDLRGTAVSILLFIGSMIGNLAPLVVRADPSQPSAR